MKTAEDALKLVTRLSRKNCVTIILSPRWGVEVRMMGLSWRGNAKARTLTAAVAAMVRDLRAASENAGATP